MRTPFGEREADAGERASSATVKITLGSDGLFSALQLVDSPFLREIGARRSAWTSPLVVFGGNREKELDAYRDRVLGKERFFRLRDAQSFVRARKFFAAVDPAVNIIDVLPRYGGERKKNTRLEPIKSISPDSLLERTYFTTESARREAFWQMRALSEEIDLLCDEASLIGEWPAERSYFLPLVVSIWSMKKRSHPLIISSPRPIEISIWSNIESAQIHFNELAREAAKAFGISAPQIEDAYRVWQLSRENAEGKTRATIPAGISFSNAESFLTVFAGARPENVRIIKAPQRAAPLIFEALPNSIDLSSNVPDGDDATVVTAGARNLRRMVARFIADPMLENVIPATKESLPVIDDLLDHIIQENYDSGHVVALGLEFNGLQWNIDTVRHQISDITMGELTGLFANAHIFLRRFEIWRSYTGVNAPSGDASEGFAEFDIARGLLVDAQSTEKLLTDKARHRVEAVLDRVSDQNLPPALREGVVKSGDNLVAATLNRAGEIAGGELKKATTVVKQEAYKKGTNAVIDFAVNNSDQLMKFADVRQWPWARWAVEILKGLPDI